MSKQGGHSNLKNDTFFLFLHFFLFFAKIYGPEKIVKVYIWHRGDGSRVLHRASRR
jgi:hypothetical protein